MIIKELISWLELCIAYWKLPEQKRCHRPNQLWISLHLRDIHGVDVLAGRCWAGQSAAGLYPDELVELPLVGTWSQAAIGTITLTQAGAYNVSISAQLSPESLGGLFFRPKFSIMSEMVRLFFRESRFRNPIRLGSLPWHWWCWDSRLGESLRLCQPGAQPL